MSFFSQDNYIVGDKIFKVSIDDKGVNFRERYQKKIDLEF